MYAGDSDDILPPTQNAEEVLWPVLIESYTKSERIRVCPSDDSRATNSYGLNELIFVDLTDFADDDPPASLPSLTSFAFPAETIMLGDAGTGDDLKMPRLDAFKLTVPDGDLNDEADARPAARHSERTNLGFVDGHSKSMKLSQFYIGQSPADRWFCLDRDEVDACQSDDD